MWNCEWMLSDSRRAGWRDSELTSRSPQQRDGESIPIWDACARRPKMAFFHYYIDNLTHWVESIHTPTLNCFSRAGKLRRYSQIHLMLLASFYLFVTKHLCWDKIGYQVIKVISPGFESNRLTTSKLCLILTLSTVALLRSVLHNPISTLHYLEQAARCCLCFNCVSWALPLQIPRPET